MKIIKSKYILFLFIYLCIIPFTLKSQISIGGVPPSFENNLSKSAIQTINVDKPNIANLVLEDELSDSKGEAYRMGILLPVNKGIHNSGTWTKLSNGDKIWQLRIMAKDALATSLYYDKFYLPEGSRLYVYNDDKTNLIGAFTNKNNHKSGLFATELIAGDATILEYYEPFKVNDTVIINISDINYAYRGVSNVNFGKNGFGTSHSCQVNINCIEGDDWQLQKAGVVRILTRHGLTTGWCTGSLVNNTLQDFKPYLLTADHCAPLASTNDLTQWMFYFNYESPSCSNPSNEGALASQSMTGAVKVAHGGNSGTTSSDFQLLLMNTNVPETYNPCFLGWDRSGDSSVSGVSIHHPAGDIKKISSYTTTLITSAYNTALSHWKVYWSATLNGHGTTEGGSSGSPIFNSSRKIIGTLSGGPSTDCLDLTAPDYYGKFYWHWDKNGDTSTMRLKEWLDPIGSNAIQLDELTYNKADFIADFNFIKAGESVKYTNKSLGSPSQFLWNFEKGYPSTSTDKNPINILYSEPGIFDVSLKAYFTTSDSSFYKTAIKTDYIRVWNDVKIFNPQSSTQLWIDFNYNIIKNFRLSIFDVLGRNMLNIENNNNPPNIFSLNISKLKTGVYFVKIKTNVAEYDKKVVIIN